MILKEIWKNRLLKTNLPILVPNTNNIKQLQTKCDESNVQCKKRNVLCVLSLRGNQISISKPWMVPLNGYLFIPHTSQDKLCLHYVKVPFKSKIYSLGTIVATFNLDTRQSILVFFFSFRERLTQLIQLLRFRMRTEDKSWKNDLSVFVLCTRTETIISWSCELAFNFHLLRDLLKLWYFIGKTF